MAELGRCTERQIVEEKLSCKKEISDHSLRKVDECVMKEEE
jgi:hypothetical protein